MHCFRCKSLMQETDRQAAGRSQVTWYQCPVCGNEQLHAQPSPCTFHGDGLVRTPFKTVRAYGGH
jgi:hypothetical protein